MAAEMKENRAKGAFRIEIIERQNSTWQGVITWLDAGETKNFRSELELLFLIESSFDSQDQTPT